MTLPKLAYLTGEYPRASDTFIQREVAALRTLGHEVETCSIRTTGAEHLVGSEQRAEHARTFKVLEACKSPIRLARAHLRWMRAPRRYLSALKLAWTTAPKGLKGRLYNLIYFLEAGVLAAHLADNDVDHLHNHIAKASCTVAMLASALSGIPYSFTIHGPDIFFEPHHWRIDEKAARASFVVCISDFCRSQLMCFADQAHWDRFHIVHCGVEPDRYPPTDRAEKWVTDLVFVGRLAGVKGVPLLLNAMRRLQQPPPTDDPHRAFDDPPALHLTIVGDGPDRAALEQQAEGLPVTFTGYRSQSEVADILSEADIFILPSFAEGLPVVLMEAMAAGLPVITTRIAGVPELVKHAYNGLLVPPGNETALYAAINTLIDSPELRAQMGEAGQETVKADFDIATEAKKLSWLFQEYTAGRQPRWTRL
ncbi:glycosyltransferase family 4 protein [Antarctobacter heliothermus]|uniref:Glycosyltransferase involved in cell wall bisynthesis n=1 Tax=Antarctobacter heliothermus TaxID=74033 RepID=A0A239E2P7_9RHOB|nr:glycosyltransferase family 4 protein [Antarctobacter heliothermus]SNS38661.1 Glycosyltransferase involved in cell wall bisynthesis [Antarctobacter heliothermus]